ncbi:Hypothetical protein A7982_05927 [Minicystis rosea]|nr:Hypothetical protein A7982_05927 [Minicystis rosea]
MALFLSEATIHRLVTAACACALDVEALVEVLPSNVRSALPSPSSRSAPRSHLLVVFNTLSTWQPRGGEEPPLRAFLKNAEFLCGDRREADVFAEALGEADERTRRASRSPHDVYMRRAKRFFVSHGYDVDPPEGERSRTFLAFRGVGIIHVVAVADDTVEEAIDAVTQRLLEMRPNEPFAEGYVVLTSMTPEKRRADEAKVREANLRPMGYTDLPPMGTPELESFVLRQQAWILAEPDPQDLSDDDMSDDPLEEILRGTLSDRDVRVLSLRAWSQRAVWHARKRIAHACSEDFRHKPDAPAPIVLPLPEHPSVDLKDLVAEAFRFHHVRFNPLALQQLLENGMLLPIFAATNGTSHGAGWPLVKQAVIGKAKAVLLASDDDASPIPSLARHLNVPSKGIHVITMRGGQTA